ncbi:5-hydroxytryptamine receptor 4-like [Mercenaria mercenaria]|uniref:5-hydroxytryptamine receptor 4-like n=1 Tax=Mercenaria mercenaria TaxID=6596 RepID=UPI001E1D49C4|nr:5-hydroxytryptamine receptor 4-like [Mercenaria mercenaria]
MVMNFTFFGRNASANQVECSTPTWGYDISAVQVLGYCLTIIPLVNISVNVITMAYIIRAPKLKANTRVFLCSLTVSNTLVGVFVLPVRIFGMITATVGISLEISYILCVVGNSFDVMLRTSSALHLSVLAYDRYLSTCRPFSRGYRLNRKFNTILFIGCWTVPAILSFGVIPPRFQLKGIVKEYNCLLNRTKMCQYITNMPYAFITTFACFIVPAAFILMCNNRTISSVKKREKVFIKLLHINTKRRSFNRRHFGTKLSRTILSMSCIFLCCWLPFFVINFTDPLTSYRVPVYIWLLVSWVGYANSVITSVIYLKSTKVLFFSCND